MARRAPSPAHQWADFAKKSMGFLSRRLSLVAMTVAIVLWLTVLGLGTPTRTSIVVFAFFAALAFGYVIPAVATHKNWPAQAMFLWAQGPRPNWKPTDDKDGLVERVNWAIEDGHDEASWREARTLASQLPADVRRAHALSMIDLFENAHFDEDAYGTAVEAVTDPAESRYWRVQFSVTQAFAAYQVGGDYLKLLLEASKNEGPFSIATPSRLRILIARVVFPILFLIVGVVLGVALAVVVGN